MKKLLASVLLASVATVAHAQDGPLIAGVVFQSDTFMQTFQDGMSAAAEERGATLLLGNSETDLVKEANLIDNYITRGIDAMIINTFSADGSVAAVQDALDEGILTVCANTCLNENARGGITSFLVTENIDLGLKTGAAAAEYINAHLGGRAKIGILNCDTFPEACLPRKQGFLDALTAGGVEYEVLADQTGFIADQALPISEAMLQANPDINILWAANEGGTTAHVLAVSGLGLAGEVQVFGTDMSGQHAQFLKADNGILIAVTGQAPFQLGYDAVMLTLDAVDGQAVEANLTVPTILFSRDNVSGIDSFVETDGRAIFAD